ncbi:MAG TPA: 2-C-methyl-D-erythritol 4-phosphate cytidylyltransferase [Candidatus Binataceae bacterium]|nr:2-C-methyl-D-erythritol 4-phosphate cytidylyltransferase [Candidatus Binataceae bacterium]
MKASAIIVAAGSGSRLGLASPKAFVTVGGCRLLHYSLATIARVPSISEAVVTVPEGMEREARDVAREVRCDLPLKVTAGGVERQDSVRIALSLTSAESDLVIVHDAARPFATATLFESCLKAAAHSGGAIAAIPVADTLKRVDQGAIISTVARAGLYQAQTPQAFRRPILLAAHERALRDRIAATDDADLVEQMGERVEIVEASGWNLKITTRADLELAEAIVAAGLVSRPVKK